MYALNLGDDGRILSATLPEYAPEDAVTVEVLPEGDLSHYRLVGGELELADDLISERSQQTDARRIDDLSAELRGTDAIVLETLEGLLTATTPMDFIAALTVAADGIKDTLADRTKLRERIEALKKEQF